MGRKRLKNRLRHRPVCQGREKIPIGSHKAGRISPFDDPWFWLSLVTVDFCVLLGMGADKNEEQTLDKENT